MRAIDRLISNCNSILHVMRDWASETSQDVTFSWVNSDGTISSHTFSNAKKLNADNSTHNSSTSNPHAVTKNQIGLSNVDNTSDVDKPLSEAAVVALGEKSDTSHSHNLNDLLEKSYNSLADKPDMSQLHDHSNKTFLDKFGEDGDGNLTYNGVLADTTIAQRDVYDGVDSDDNTISLSAKMGKYLFGLLGGKEDSFAKNTAFNKSFGTGSGEVSEGDHEHSLHDLVERSYNSLTNKPSLDRLHEHDNISTLEKLTYNAAATDYKLDGYIVSRFKVFDDDNVLHDYVPQHNYEMAYSSTKERMLVYHMQDGTWRELSTGEILAKAGQGTGPSGTYANGWEDESDIDLHWKSDLWGNKVNGTDGAKWNRRTGATPSSNTGPSAAGEGSYYVYAEASSNGHLENFRLSCRNFKIATEISFKYHMYGSQEGTLDLVTITGGVETVRWTENGDKGDVWSDQTIDLTGLEVEEIVFNYHDISGYIGDMALDMISITSIEE